MTNEQKVLFDLLLEVKTLCEENDIEMYLTEYLLLDAYRNGEVTGTYHDFSVFIHSKDVKKFIDLASKKENREIECLLTNAKFPGTYIRYVKKDSLYYPLYRYKAYKCSGFAVNIKTFKNIPKNKLKEKILAVLEAGMEATNNKHRLTKKRMVYMLIVWAMAIIGPKNRGKLIFNLLNGVKDKEAKSKEYYFKPLFKKRIKYEKKMFEKTRDILLNGETFKIPDSEDYLKKSAGDLKRAIPTPSYGATYIIDKDICYKDFLAECDRQHFPKSFYTKRTILGLMDLIIKPYRKKVQKCWNLLYRTRDRFILWEKYMPLKEQILGLYNEQKWEELDNILADYIAMLKLYAGKRLGIAFDPEIYDITMELLNNEGKEDLVEKVKKYMPKQYLIPLDKDLGL